MALNRPVSSKNRNVMAGVCSTCMSFCHRNNYRGAENCSKNENTAKSTGFWLSVWKNWCVDKEITDEIENYEPAEFNTLLEHFYAEVNNKKGEDYEPGSLKVIMASLDRHLKNKGCTLSIVRDREFSSSKEVLGDKAKRQTKLGKYL